MHRPPARRCRRPRQRRSPRAASWAAHPLARTRPGADLLPRAKLVAVDAPPDRPPDRAEAEAACVRPPVRDAELETVAVAHAPPGESVERDRARAARALDRAPTAPAAPELDACAAGDA